MRCESIISGGGGAGNGVAVVVAEGGEVERFAMTTLRPMALP